MSMTMQTLSFKKHEGLVHNPIGQWSSPPWWSCAGSEPVYGESVDKLMPCVGHSTSGGRVTASKQVLQGTDKGLEKGNVSHFIVFPGDDKSQANGEKPPELQAAISMQAVPPGHIELGFDQPAIGAKYLYGNECYGVVSTCGPSVKGRMMLPLSLTKDDGPIYVNPKQYHGIIRRRLSRAKEESNKAIQRARKPYLHLSRHLHAMRRQRGCGGRFVNTKKSQADKGGNTMEQMASLKLSLPSESQNSEVLQSDSRNLISSKERNGRKSDLPGSEATRMFLRRELELNPFTINLSSSIHSHSQARNFEHGSHFMPGMWAAAADNSCNLNV